MPRILGPMVKPGVSFSTTRLAKPSRPSTASVRASRVTPNDMSVPALEMNVLRPLISHPPSRRSARVRIPRASDPASGSVSPNAPSTRPSARGRSQRSRWSSFPNRRRGSEPMVTWACQAAATDWSAWPICSMAATKPTVDMPIPPHCSGTSMPSRPSAPISRRRSVGQRASSQASGARGAISRLGEVAAEADEVAFCLVEGEVHGSSIPQLTARPAGGPGRTSTSRAGRAGRRTPASLLISSQCSATSSMVGAVAT